MATPEIVFSLTGDLYRNARALKQIRALAAMNWRIRVFHIPGEAPPVALPDGVTVEPVHLQKNRGVGFFREVSDRFLQAAGSVGAACYHASDLYVLSAMCRSAAIHDAAYTYDSRELYAHVAATQARPWVRWYWEFIESRYIGGAAAVFTVSERIAGHLSKAYGIPPPILVHNVPPRRNVVPSNRLATLAGVNAKTPIVLHLGQMRRARGCESLVRAMATVPEAMLIFLGYGPEKENLEALSRRTGLEERVRFLDPVPADEVMEYASGASLGATLLEDTCLNHRYALPNKLFDYLAAGIPVLASDLPEMRSIVEGYNVGKVVNPSDPEAVAGALVRMLDGENDRNSWKRNAARLCETFNWENASQRFVSTFRQILAGYRAREA